MRDDDDFIRRVRDALTDGADPVVELHSVCALVCGEGLGDLAQVYAVEPDDVHLRIVAVTGADPRLAADVREALSRTVARTDASIAGAASRSGAAVVVNDVQDRDDLALPAGVRAYLRHHDVRHMAGFGIPFRAAPVGALLVSRIGDSPPFDADEIATLGRVAAAIALAVELQQLRRRVERQADILDRVGDAVIAIDENRVVTKWNRGAENLYGIRREEAMGASLGDLVSTVSLDEESIAAAWAEIHDDTRWRDVVHQVTRDGRTVDVEAVVTPLVDAEAGFSGAVAVNRDISDSLRQQRELAEKQAFAEALLDALPGRTCVIGVDGHVRAVNARYEREGPFGEGAGSGPVVGDDMIASLGLLSPTTAGAGVLLDALRTTLRDGSGSPSIDVPGAGSRWTSAQVNAFSGAGGGALVTFLDVSDRKLHELELAHQATHDALTDLPNRALLLDRLREGLSRAHRRGHLLAVLFVDLDELKAVNDSQGHDAGDLAIRAAAARLSLACRSCDTVARVGGDEFVVLLEELHSRAEAEELATRMLASLGTTEHLESSPAGAWPAAIPASVGVALSDVATAPLDHDGADLVRRADIAMLTAKRSGKGRIVAEASLDGQAG